MVGTVRAALAVRPSVRFVVGELRGGLRRYRTRTGSVVMVRHRSRDVALINEIFGHLHAYEPPPELQGDLAGPLQILDLGGNIGMFGVFALERWAVQRIRSVEPDPANASVLAAVIAANRAEDRWTLTRAAASNRPGTMRFLSGRLTESRQALEHEPGIEVDAIDTFAMAGHVDLLKIDIESGEWAILTDPRLRSLQARVLVMEWHWLGAPGPDPHRAACELLADAGYELVADRPDPVAGATGLLWACRT